MSKDKTVEDLEAIALEIATSLSKKNLTAQQVFYVMVRVQADAIGSIVLDVVQKLLDARERIAA